MRYRTLEQFNSRWLDGRVLSAGAGVEADVDDADADAVAHVKHLAETGRVEILDDSEPETKMEPQPESQPESQPVPEQPPAEPTLAELREQAEAKGLPTYGTKAQLTERLAQAEQDTGESE